MNKDKPPAQLEPAIPASELADPTNVHCHCWHNNEQALKKLGFAFSSDCCMFTVNEQKLDLHLTYGLPLVRTDGKRLSRSDPKMMQIAYCPFCGRKYD